MRSGGRLSAARPGPSAPPQLDCFVPETREARRRNHFPEPRNSPEKVIALACDIGSPVRAAAGNGRMNIIGRSFLLASAVPAGARLVALERRGPRTVNPSAASQVAHFALGRGDHQGVEVS